ncbi:MAG: 30S ribosomal protein S6 [Lachnospiraceae bacterium]|jgi:small subunit ribosomal protein S6|nr:30S ribosomal protein S6 [Lachnospiraceae bacterium]MBR2532497.1 30S ribosomal protein S6 [Lachnospiraceae bacterium]
MNKYEVTVILSAKLEEEARAEMIERIKGYIVRYNGTVGEIEEWGKKRLAYEIQRQTEGFYYIINFEGDQTTPNGLESELRIIEPVLRYLVVRKAD